MSKAQHRSQRDTSRRELTELKQENKTLKRKISRLQKQIEKGMSIIDEDRPETEKSDDLPESVEMPKNGLFCTVCESSSDIGSYTTITGKTIYGCRKCKKWQYRPE